MGVYRCDGADKSRDLPAASLPAYTQVAKWEHHSAAKAN
jgi:hypothetical protein